MATTRGRRRGSAQTGGGTADVSTGLSVETLQWLTPSLIGVLASLHGAPRDLAEAAVQLLPFGSRTALEIRGLAEPVGDEVNGYRTLRLTDLAFEVMAEAAMAAESTPEAVDELHDRAAQLIARVCAGGTD